jgi:hypothetical protein
VTRFNAKRDAAVADAAAADRHLYCHAEGCPNRWSCDMGKGRLCSWHDRSEPHHWPRITQEQLDAQADRARAAAEPMPQTWPLSRAQKLAILARLRDVVVGRTFDPHRWARNLQSKRAAGITLSPAQRACLAEFESRHAMTEQGGDAEPVSGIRDRKERAQELTDRYQRQHQPEQG